MSKVALCGSWTKSTDTVSSRFTAKMPRNRFDFAASTMSALISSAEVSRAESNLKSMTETSAVGTRIEVPSSLPLSDGMTRPMARAAPVEVGIMESAAEILVQRVHRVLVAGIGVDRRHVAALDADPLVQHIGDRRQAIGGAGAVRDHRMLALHFIAVDPHDQREVDAVGGRRDDDAPRSCLEMLGGRL